jgi:hypothetical protein
MSDDAQKEIQELLRTVEVFEVHYDRPTASARRPGVAYPVSPQEQFTEALRWCLGVVAAGSESLEVHNGRRVAVCLS